MPAGSYERLVALLLAIMERELVARQLRLPPIALAVPARSEIGIMNPDLAP